MRSAGQGINQANHSVLQAKMYVRVKFDGDLKNNSARQGKGKQVVAFYYESRYA